MQRAEIVTPLFLLLFSLHIHTILNHAMYYFSASVEYIFSQLIHQTFSSSLTKNIHYSHSRYIFYGYLLYTFSIFDQ